MPAGLTHPPQGINTLTNPVIQGTVKPGTGLTMPLFTLPSKNADGPSAEAVPIAGALAEGLIVTSTGKYYDPGSDIGATLNSIFSAHVNGVTIWLPPGTYACSTSIDLDLLHTQGTIIIAGQGCSAGVPLGGTLIDGRAMTAPVLKGARTKSNYNLFLRDFTIRGGSADGIVIGDVGWSAAHSEIRNVVVQEAGGFGFRLHNMYNSFLSHLYAVTCSQGFYFYVMNTAVMTMITARDGTHDTEAAVEIFGGNGFTLTGLYIESNNGGALSWYGPARGSRVEGLYLEHNNRSGLAAVEVFLGDGTKSTGVSEQCSISGGYITSPAFPWTDSIIKVDFAQRYVLEMIRCGPGTPRNVHFTNSRLGGFLFKNCFFTGEVDTSLAAGPSFWLGKNSIGGIDKRHVDFVELSRSAPVAWRSSGNLVLDRTHEVVSVNAAGAARTVTLPPAAGYKGKTYTIKKVDSTANTVTIDPDGTETIDGNTTKVLSAQWNYVKIISDGTNWIIIGEGAGG